MFGEKLKELRRSKGISQTQLAKTFGVVQQTVGMWETNKSAPNYDLLKQIASYFGVTTDYLLGSVSKKEFVLSDEQSKLLQRFDSLPNEGQKEFISYFDYLQNKYEKAALSSLAAPMSGATVTESNFAG